MRYAFPGKGIINEPNGSGDAKNKAQTHSALSRVDFPWSSNPFYSTLNSLVEGCWWRRCQLFHMMVSLGNQGMHPHLFVLCSDTESGRDRAVRPGTACRLPPNAGRIRTNPSKRPKFSSWLRSTKPTFSLDSYVHKTALRIGLVVSIVESTSG